MNGRPWTPSENATLRELWGTTILADIAARLGRTVSSVYARATGSLGLATTKPGPGLEYLSHAARRTGFSQEGLASVLRAHGVELQSSPGKRKPRHWARSSEVDAAVKAWLASETVGAAAERLNVPAKELRARLVAAGHRKPASGPWRLPSSVIEACLQREGAA